MTRFKFQKVTNYLYDFIIQNRSTPNKKIPSERTLSQTLDVSRTTVKYAIDKLVDERVLYKVHGKGTFITASHSLSRMRIGKDVPDAFSLNARSDGLHPTSTTLSFKVLYDYEELSHIFPKEITDFYELIRIRSLNQRPFSVEKCYFPFHIFSDANRYDFSKTSLYEYMSYKGKKPVSFNKKIEVVYSKEYNQLLGLNPNYPLFLETYIARDYQQDVVEYTEIHADLQSIEHEFYF